MGAAAAVSDEQILARSRQQIVSILQRFKFVRQCIKCSAKNLLNVDEIFLKAQQAVLYPITPLYDLNQGKIAHNCHRAFSRIFRMYDKDNDDLLSNAEINAFQNDAFRVPLVERDLAGWKKVVSKNNPSEESVIRNGKFTVAGFLAIFDVFISQNRLEVPWRILRAFGYDDDLNLDIPESVTSPPPADAYYSEYPSWSLTPSARNFLTATFHQFDRDNDGKLSMDDILAIFAIVPEPSLPPWHPFRTQEVFGGCFSFPRLSAQDVPPGSVSMSLSRTPSPPPPVAASYLGPLSASEITISSTDDLPSVDVSRAGSNSNSQSESDSVRGNHAASLTALNFNDWMGHWHMINAISPISTRTELYRLGHMEAKSTLHSSRRRQKINKKPLVPPITDALSLLSPSKELRVFVLGSRNSGKTSLLNALSMDSSRMDETKSPLETQSTDRPQSCCIQVEFGHKGDLVGVDKDIEEGRKGIVVHMIFTEVPQGKGGEEERIRADLKATIGDGTAKRRKCDLVVLAYDVGSQSSLSYAMELEGSLLTDDVPRVYVGTKADCRKETDAGDAAGESTPVGIAKNHCSELDLDLPLLTSASLSMLGGHDSAATKCRAEVLRHFARCALNDKARSTPYADKKRRDAAKRRRVLWLGGILSVSAAVVIGVSALLGSRNEGKKERSVVGLFKSLFGVASSIDSSVPMAAVSIAGNDSS